MFCRTTVHMDSPSRRGYEMAKCEICGKGPQFGNRVSFSMRHTRHMWKANVQRKTIWTDGKPRTVYACAKCLKTMQKNA